MKRGYSETYYSGDYPEEYILTSGDLLIGMDGEFNIARWKNNGALLNQRVCKLTAKKGINEEYLRFAMSKALKKIEQKTAFVTVKHLSAKELNKLQLYVPDLSEQNKIAEILSRLEAIIDVRRQELEKMDELIKSRFIEMFGDPHANPFRYKQAKLSDVATYFNGLTYKPENVSEIGTIVLRSSNIQNNQLDFTDIVRVNCPVKDRLMVRENDILMCSRNGSAKLVGKVALIKEIQEPMTFGAFMLIIRSRYYRYLMTYFQLDAFRQQIKTGATTTINQITGRMLDDVMIPLPPMALIEQFTIFVDQTEKSKVAVQRALDETQLLFDSLMQKYFG